MSIICIYGIDGICEQLRFVNNQEQKEINEMNAILAATLVIAAVGLVLENEKHSVLFHRGGWSTVPER